MPGRVELSTATRHLEHAGLSQISSDGYSTSISVAPVMSSSSSYVVE